MCHRDVEVVVGSQASTKMPVLSARLNTECHGRNTSGFRDDQAQFDVPISISRENQIPNYTKLGWDEGI